MSIDPSVFTIVDADPGGGVLIRGVADGEVEESGLPAAAVSAARFTGEAGQTLPVVLAERLVVAVGLGDRSAVSVADVRAAAGNAVRAAGGAEGLVIDLGPTPGIEAATATGAVVEGVLGATYRFTVHKSATDEAPTMSSVALVGGNAEGLARGVAVARGVAMARDLVNEPGGSLTPTEMADRCLALAEEGELECEVWGPAELAEQRCGGMLAVNAGSTEEPRLIRLSYRPENPTATWVLVGKGITFDSGGLSLKTSEGMMSMKGDMGGAAAVIGALSALPALRPDVAVVGIVCATDNMPSGSAQRPGDVFTARNGTTVEVLNTDAEGRLVLADGLSLAAELEPDAIVDLATLTGAAMVALGGEIAGLMGNDEGLIDEIRAAAGRAGEEVWPLPLPQRYRRQLDSTVADLKNIGAGRYGGALTAGLFLQEFVGQSRWVHLDIAGTEATEADAGDQVKGATGFGVRTLIAALGA